jgi:glycosyltransferase involved in cell wall biosynthesis
VPSEAGESLCLRQNLQTVNVVFIIDSLRRHGAQRFLTYLARGLSNLGCVQRVIVLNKARDSDIEEALSSARCAITYIGKFALLLGGAGWWRLVGILKRTSPDVVMTMLDFADTLGRPAARLAGCHRLVTSIQVRNLAKPVWQRWLDRKTVRWADKVIFNSGQVVNYAREKEGIRKDQVVIIPNGVEDLRTRSGALRADSRRQLGLGPKTLLLGSVARLYPQKNLSLFLRAMAKLSTLQQWKALVVGDGPERRQLLALADELSLTDRVIWLGAQPDVGGWLAAMDVFVHTSDFEGMPNAVMEAMAMGLPVVASAVDGTCELIEDGVSGYLLPPGDVDAFAKTIRELMKDPDRAHQVGEKAHRDVLERFGMDRMIEAYEQLFLSLVNSKSA